jgi:hypothetical protein
VLVGAALSVLLALAGASSALAGVRGDLQRFANCPYNNTAVTECIYSDTTGGEFVIGKSTVPISRPVVIQAGLKALGYFVPATNGETLSKTPLPVPGGLIGIELPGNFTEVTATAELAGEAQLRNSVTLPLKVKLDNLALGGNCYIGSEAEPVTLNLVYGTTNPPPPNKPITGNAVIVVRDHAITQITGTLVDNAFAAPGATGCTLLPLVGDLAVNLKEGLPAAAGTNTAIMRGVTEEVPSRVVKNVLPLPDLGRCVKVEPTLEGKTKFYNGAFENSACIAESAQQTGKYEWLPGPGAKPAFTGTGGATTLETVGAKTKVKCTASASHGVYTSPKGETVAITLTGCATGPNGQPVTCQSSGAAAGEIRTNALSGGIDFIKENEAPVKPEVGLDLKAASGSDLVSFDCGARATAVSGSVIAGITVDVKPSTALKVKATQAGGKQSVEAFEEGAKDTLTFTPSGGTPEAGGLTATETRTNEEPLEIKAEG